MKEYVKFNCHVLQRNDLDKNMTPEKLKQQYDFKRGAKDYDLILRDTECVIESCEWASGRSGIITKVKRKDT